jgi:hypothetical protein
MQSILLADLHIPATHVGAGWSASLPSQEAVPHTVPSAVGEQVPCFPATAHDWQAPQDADPQQNPSVQKPLMHSPAAPHAAPFAFRLVHELPWQVYPATQSELVVHVVLHAVAPQT